MLFPIFPRRKRRNSWNHKRRSCAGSYMVELMRTFMPETVRVCICVCVCVREREWSHHQHRTGLHPRSISKYLRMRASYTPPVDRLSMQRNRGGMYKHVLSPVTLMCEWLGGVGAAPSVCPLVCPLVWPVGTGTCVYIRSDGGMTVMCGYWLACPPSG